ncbi:MAG: LytTR family DNA-binding domain-containing protein, partial [Bacteroidota bacterium]
EVLAQLQELPQIIFSTAYDKYALEAFEHNAVDYLLKPYTRSRFAKAIERVRKNGGHNLDQIKALTENLLQQQNQSSYPIKILVQSGQKLVSINTADIIWISAEKDYATLVTEKQKYLSNYGIGQLEEKLNPLLFKRVHRSSMINVNYIQEIFKYAAAYDVRMTNGDIVKVSRSYLEVIRDLTF